MCDVIYRKTLFILAYYANALDVDSPKTAAGYATARGRGSYATASTRPDMICTINQSAQHCADLADQNDFESMAEATKLLKKPLIMQLSKMDLSTANLRIYCDAS